MIRDNARSKELKNTKALNLIWMIKEWAANLNRNFDPEPMQLIDSLAYLLIDTSIIRLDNPIKNLDIKKVRLDSIKLDNILLEFENGV